MTAHSPNQPADTGNGDTEPRQTGPMAMCPMSGACKGMSTKALPKFLLPLPGLFLIAAGVLIILIPALLVWLIAAASITMGVMMLVIASFIRKMGDRFQHTQP
jgi:hypothetical protein